MTEAAATARRPALSSGEVYRRYGARGAAASSEAAGAVLLAAGKPDEYQNFASGDPQKRP